MGRPGGTSLPAEPGAVEKQNPGRVIGPLMRTTGTVPGCSALILHGGGGRDQNEQLGVL